MLDKYHIYIYGYVQANKYIFMRQDCHAKSIIYFCHYYGYSWVFVTCSGMTHIVYTTLPAVAVN